MIQAIQEDRERIVNGEDGKRTLQFAFAFYESAEKNKELLSMKTN
jgi:UDP-N-acetyl-2-amino-2-deoxyglucuronate dehydrogenase